MSGTLIEIIKDFQQNNELWQWDTGRQIKITPKENAIIDEVHFSNAYSKDALVVNPQVNEQGSIVADIPNILLWQVFPINVYVVMDFPNGKGTIYEEQLKINSRKKPSDYVYTETEVRNYESLEERIKALEENGTGGGGGITKETDPTVPQWAKEPTKPSYTADEVGAIAKNEFEKFTLNHEKEFSKLSEDIADIKQNGTGTGNGATTAQANSLWVIIQKSAFAQQLTDAEINEFKTTWGITEEVEPDTPTTYTITRNLTNCTSSSEVTSIDEGSAYTETITANNGYTLTGATVSVTMGDSDITSSYSNGVLNISSVTGNIVLTVSAVQETTEPDNPEVTLTSISATYTGGSVAVGTELTSLTGIAVTATYSDGSTATVTDYTLSGTIAEGSNTITVSYGGKTTTFTVTGVAEETDPLYGTYWPPAPIYANINSSEYYTYTGNSGEYIDAGLPSSNAVRLNDKLEGTVYIRTLTSNQYGTLSNTYTLYANDDGEIATGGFSEVKPTITRSLGTMVVNDKTYYFVLFKFEIPSGKKGLFVSAMNSMQSEYFISTDKNNIDEEYKQYYTLFTSDPTDRITEGATEVNV